MTNNIENKIIIAFFTFLMAVSIFSDNYVFAQFSPDSSGLSISNMIPGARTAGLGNTQVSDANNLESIYVNPAAFLFSESTATVSTNVFYSSYYNVMAENISGIIVRNEATLLAVGVSIHHNGPGGDFTAGSPQLPVSFNQYDLSIQYAAALGPTVSIGGGVTGSFGSTQDASNWALIPDFGLFYAPNSSVSYGLAYSGLGGGPDNLGGGLRYTYVENGTSVESEGGYTEITLERAPHRLEIGTTLRFPTMSQQPDFKVSFANEKIFGEEGLIYKAGLEIFPLEKIALRGGYVFSESTNGGRLGIGLLLETITVDYSYSENNTGFLGNSHMLGFSMSFRSQN